MCALNSTMSRLIWKPLLERYIERILVTGQGNPGLRKVTRRVGIHRGVSKQVVSGWKTKAQTKQAYPTQSSIALLEAKVIEVLESLFYPGRKKIKQE